MAMPAPIPAEIVTPAAAPMVDPRTRALLLAVRQALIIALGAVEEYLGMERSIVPRRKRGAE
jgi:hypothetical protein